MFIKQILSSDYLEQVDNSEKGHCKRELILNLPPLILL